MKDLKGGNFADSDPTPKLGLERWGSDRHPDREQVPEKTAPTLHAGPSGLPGAKPSLLTAKTCDSAFRVLIKPTQRGKLD